MNKFLIKKVYEAPSTMKSVVEIEGTFCSSATITNPSGPNGQIEEHKINDDFTFGFGNNEWDEKPRNN